MIPYCLVKYNYILHSKYPKKVNKMTKIVELTKENESQYLDKIGELEELTLEVMKKEGREGQLFATGKEDISEYVHSDENTVIVAVDEKDNLEGAAYITQGQKPFTYNDITKYFKYGEKYQKYVKSQYQNEQQYKKDLLDMYQTKLKAFKYAKNKILSERQEEKNFEKYLEKEIQENEFHEKSELREKMNRYMSEYIIENYEKDVQDKYQQFYWTSIKDIEKEFGKSINVKNKDIKEYEKMLKHSRLKIHENPKFDVSKYYSSNTGNAIELDTYITSPSSRSAGIARMIVFEGIKKHMEDHFTNPNNKEIFLCSTLHRDNLSSKYVSEFFGLTDSLYVNRRQGRDREVHICKIERERAMEYINSISDKLAVLYGYNPHNRRISEETQARVLNEQIQYEQKEFNRLKKARKTDKKFKGINIKFIESKRKKIKNMQEKLQSVKHREEER